MKIKKLTALALTLLMLLSLAACGAQEPASPVTTHHVTSEDTVPESAAITVTDMVGRQVTVVPGSYKRVVCIGAGALRLYSYVCDTALLCGVEDIDNLTLSSRPQMFDSVARPYVMAYGDVFSALPSCGVGGPNAQTAEAEKILSCEPDIVISEYEDADKANALQEQLGVPVITLRTGQNGVFDEPFRNSLTLLGRVFKVSDRAEALISFVDNQIADITARTASISSDDRPGVYICGLGNWGTTNHLMTSQNYAAFKAANIRNVVTDLEKDGLQAIEEEKFTALGPGMDIMIIDAAAVKNIKPLFREDPKMFSSCSAWKNGEVYLQMAYNAYYINYEISLVNTWFIAKTVYPELFEDIDITAKTDEITEAFLGAALADEIFSCPASYGGYGKIDTMMFFEE